MAALSVPPLSRLMTSMTLTEVTLPGRIRYITRGARGEEKSLHGRGREGRRGGGEVGGTSAVREERGEPAGQRRKTSNELSGIEGTHNRR